MIARYAAPHRRCILWSLVALAGVLATRHDAAAANEFRFPYERHLENVREGRVPGVITPRWFSYQPHAGSPPIVYVTDPATFVKIAIRLSLDNKPELIALGVAVRAPDTLGRSIWPVLDDVPPGGVIPPRNAIVVVAPPRDVVVNENVPRAEVHRLTPTQRINGTSNLLTLGEKAVLHWRLEAQVLSLLDPQSIDNDLIRLIARQHSNDQRGLYQIAVGSIRTVEEFHRYGLGNPLNQAAVTQIEQLFGGKAALHRHGQAMVQAMIRMQDFVESQQLYGHEFDRAVREAIDEYRARYARNMAVLQPGHNPPLLTPPPSQNVAPDPPARLPAGTPPVRDEPPAKVVNTFASRHPLLAQGALNAGLPVIIAASGQALDRMGSPIPGSLIAGGVALGYGARLGGITKTLNWAAPAAFGHVVAGAIGADLGWQAGLVSGVAVSGGLGYAAGVVARRNPWVFTVTNVAGFVGSYLIDEKLIPIDAFKLAARNTHEYNLRQACFIQQAYGPFTLSPYVRAGDPQSGLRPRAGLAVEYRATLASLAGQLYRKTRRESPESTDELFRDMKLEATTSVDAERRLKEAIESAFATIGPDGRKVRPDTDYNGYRRRPDFPSQLGAVVSSGIVGDCQIAMAHGSQPLQNMLQHIETIAKYYGAVLEQPATLDDLRYHLTYEIRVGRSPLSVLHGIVNSQRARDAMLRRIPESIAGLCLRGVMPGEVAWWMERQQKDPFWTHVDVRLQLLTAPSFSKLFADNGADLHQRVRDIDRDANGPYGSSPLYLLAKAYEDYAGRLPTQDEARLALEPLIIGAEESLRLRLQLIALSDTARARLAHALRDFALTEREQFNVRMLMATNLIAIKDVPRVVRALLDAEAL